MDKAWIGILVVAVIVFIVVVAFVVGRQLERKRTEELRLVADELGFEFQAEADGLLAEGIGSLPLFSRGHSKKATNSMCKLVRDRDVILLDYKYTVGHGKHAHTHRHTVAVFQPDRHTRYPDFEMRPETFFHKIGAMFGYQDIDFESHPKFSKRYLVRGTDETGVRATFSRPVLDFLESSATPWSVETRSNWLAIYHNTRAKPPEIRQFLTDTTKIFLMFGSQSSAS